MERYIESVAKEYLNNLCDLISQYNDLPDKIKDNHLQKSIDLINNLKLDKYQNFNQNDIISNLYSCHCSDSSYTLNYDAYTHHTANFRHEAVNKFFQELGIENINQKILKNDNFKSYLVQSGLYPQYFLEKSDKQDYRRVLEKIDEIVQIRNYISHGQQKDELQLIGLELFNDSYINFIEQYVYALQEILLKELLPFKVKKKGINLGKAEKVIDNSIVCIEVTNVTIKIGDRIISHNSKNNTYAQGKIVSIQIDGQEFEQLSETESTIAIGIKVDFKVKDNQEFYLISIVN